MADSSPSGKRTERAKGRATGLRGWLTDPLATVIAAIITAIATTLGTLWASDSKASDNLTRSESVLVSVNSAVPIGTVIASLLNQTRLADVTNDVLPFDPRKSKWALASDQDVSGSEYAKQVAAKVPDLRGMFLRGMNEGRKDGDPDTTRAPGAEQPFATALPVTEFALSKAGSHQHYFDNDSIGHVGKSSGSHGPGPAANPAYGSGPMGAAGEHIHNISGGDKETRPKNVAVYYYVRINR